MNRLIFQGQNKNVNTLKSVGMFTTNMDGGEHGFYKSYLVLASGI